ncbi:hypothetical protein SETIT_3G107000v2 [Setaria italica]|uniref:Uncharacterized protein n=1 Tax=Setaria italica TaxID=4555 RepID=A0A368QEB1_SETIT|nr:hypothetical protein SETIT_3G107000v2 [Setaria italica]
MEDLEPSSEHHPPLPAADSRIGIQPPGEQRERHGRRVAEGDGGQQLQPPGLLAHAVERQRELAGDGQELDRRLPDDTAQPAALTGRCGGAILGVHAILRLCVCDRACLREARYLVARGNTASKGSVLPNEDRGGVARRRLIVAS